MGEQRPIWRQFFTWIRWAAEAYGIWQLFALFGGTVLTTALLAIFFEPVRDAALGWQIMLLAGIGFLWLVFVRATAPVVIGWLSRHASLTPPKRGEANAPAENQGGSGGAELSGGSAPSPKSGIEFYPNRQTPAWYAQQLQEAERASVSWNTGSILRDLKVLQERKNDLERVILPHPFSINLDALAEAAGDSAEELKNKIRQVTRDLIDYKIDVRWRLAMPTNLVTVCNDWVLIENFFPHLNAGDRPQWRICRAEYPELHKRLRAVFDSMWAESQQPPPLGSAEWTI